MKTIRLKPGKEKSLLRRHPWIFESAIAKGSADAGETVRIESFEGQFLAWAAFSPSSKIRARVWSFDEKQRIDGSFFIAACAYSVSARGRFDIKSNGVRLVHGESDGLPGLIVDRYGDTLVAQFTSAGAERWKTVLAEALLQATHLTKLYERSDANSRALEGLPQAKGWLRGQGEVDLVLQEHDWQLAVNIAEGHKTGFYLDQRDSRKRFFDYTRRLKFGRCSIAIATPAGLLWRRWQVARRTSRRSTPLVRRWRWPLPMWCATVSRPRGLLSWMQT